MGKVRVVFCKFAISVVPIFGHYCILCNACYAKLYHIIMEVVAWVDGYIGFTLSVCPSVPPTSRVRSVARCLFHGLYSYVAQIQPMRRQCVSYHFQVNKSKVKVTRVICIFEISAGCILVDHPSTNSSYYWTDRIIWKMSQKHFFNLNYISAH